MKVSGLGSFRDSKGKTGFLEVRLPLLQSEEKGT